MRKQEVLYRKVQAHNNGEMLVVSIPKREIAKPLGLEPGDILQVHFDLEEKRWIYQVMEIAHANRD